MKICIASNNLNKIKEIESILKDKKYELYSLKDLGFNKEIEETGKTFKENALIKAKTIYDLYHLPVISDDSGLEVEALDMQPGVYSHRYAGDEQNDEANNLKLIKNLKGIKNRKARYTCTICYYNGNQVKYFEDYCYGEIVDEKKGSNGFGYDPYFYLKDFKKNMAELTLEEKNSISHRAKAVRKLGVYLNEIGCDE